MAGLHRRTHERHITGVHSRAHGRRTWRPPHTSTRLTTPTPPLHPPFTPAPPLPLSAHRYSLNHIFIQAHIYSECILQQNSKFKSRDDKFMDLHVCRKYDKLYNTNRCIVRHCVVYVDMPSKFNELHPCMAGILSK